MGAVLTDLRRHVTTVLLLGWCAVAVLTGLAGLVGAASPASAAAVACPFQSVADSTKQARAVFSGAVLDSTRVEKVAPDRGALFDHDVRVDRVYKGSVDSEQVVVQTDQTPQACSLGRLETGTEYVFFVQPDGDAWVAPSAGGTAAQDARLEAAVTRILGDGRAPTPPAPEEAVFTSAEPGTPVSATRAAAPGVALVLVGLLGLVVVRRVNARR